MLGKQGWTWPRVEETEPFKTNPTTVGGSGRRVQFLHGTPASLDARKFWLAEKHTVPGTWHAII